MKNLLTVLVLNFSVGLYAQKPPLDTAAISAWPHITDDAISNDGIYVFYNVREESHAPVLYIQSTKEPYKLEIRGGDGAVTAFTDDSKRVIGQKEGDSLFIVDLISRKVSYTPGVSSYSLPKAGSNQWMVYTLSTGEMILADLYSGARTIYGQVQEYHFSDNGKILIVERKVDSTANSNNLLWVDLEKGGKKVIYTGGLISGIKFSEQADRLAFVSSSGSGSNLTQELCWYNSGEDSARVVAGGGTAIMEAGYEVATGGLEFSQDGGKLFFYVRRLHGAPVPLRIGASVDVWNYKDQFLPFEGGGNRLEVFRAVYHMASGKVAKLQEETDDPVTKIDWGDNDNFLLATKNCNPCKGGLFQDSNWSTLYLINTENGSRKVIAEKDLNSGAAEFSPSGRYVLWFDNVTRAYLAYDVKQGMCRNISSRIPFSMVDDRDGGAGPRPEFGWATWLPGDSGLLVYDHYDIWSVDPKGMKPPKCLTGGFGRRSKIVLRCSYERSRNYWSQIFETEKKELILCALDEKNKYNGFFKLGLARPYKLEQLCMDSALYYFSGRSSYAVFPTVIRKAGDAQRYLLVKMSVTEYPNLVVTGDFRKFSQITDLQPQQKYNWLRGELVRWQTFSGHTGEGIIFKPEDFDLRKKYPVILHYYERESDGLNNFLHADFCHGSMNIPWFVSRGYVVFCPDISYSTGDPGAGIYDYVVSAAQMLAAKPWVERHRIGIQGHSFGGFETNFLLTRTKLFAAAASSAGVSDMISESGETGLGFCAGESFVEFGQFRMGVPFWLDLRAYMRNSAVFQVKKIVTPLLILQNKNDISIPWAQGIELFTALRRLGKPVWMLQYDRQGHNIFENSARDYTIRLTQFFDHYLRGLGEPVWMSTGVPNQWKGIEDGLGISSER